MKYPNTLLAFDKSVRRFDQDGRLHVATTPISKANICEYFGSEIPDAEALGLKPDQKFRLYRDAAELERAAPTFNNIPLLTRHVPVTADAPRPDLVVGSTGTDAAFEAPYLRNSLVVWDADAIQAVESGKQKELSCAYHYRADMTPGEVGGEKYDGVMRDIRGNHVALVEEGRAGPDVVVGDSKPKEIDMANAKGLSRKAQLVRGALSVYLRPKLASDAKIDLKPVLLGATALNWPSAKPAIAERLKSAVKGKLAQDANLEDVNAFLDSLDKEGEGEPEEMADAAPEEKPGTPTDPQEPGERAEDADDPMEAILEFLKSKLAPEDLVELRAMANQAKDRMSRDKARDAEPSEEEKRRMEVEAKEREAKDRRAMDAKITEAVTAAEQRILREAHAVREAERIVRPWIGELAIAQDSADAVYRFALDTLGVKVDGVHPSAFRAVLEAQPKPGDRKPAVPAMDAAAAKSFSERFPEASRIRNI